MESLIIELDSSLEIILECVSNFEEKVLNKMSRLKGKFKNELNMLKNVSLESIRLNDLEKCGKNVKKLNRKLRKFRVYNSKSLLFDENDKCPYPMNYGKFVNNVNFRKITESMINQFYYKESRIINLDNLKLFKATGMCSLDNLHLAIYNIDNEVFQINKDFEITKTNKISSSFLMRTVSSIASNHNENIYLSDTTNSQILFKNINEKNLIRCVGSFGYSNSEFSNPCSICYYKDSIYILDKGNRRIKVYSSDCVFQKNILLWNRLDMNEYPRNPRYISISENLIGVADDTRYIYFYNFDEQLIRILKNGNYGVHSFLCIDSYVFIHGYSGSLRCYDLCKLKEDSLTPKFERYIEVLKNKSISMSYFNESLIILFQDFNYLAII